jgi:rare lipoprotein A (peptidoglycan hydrolase)
VNTGVGRRAAALAGIALLGIAIVLAVAHDRPHKAVLPTPAGQWYSALAAPYSPSTARKKSACGVVIGPRTAGVAHPVLPCGVKIYIDFAGKQVLTQVIDRGHTAPGRTFDVTEALAKLLGLQGSQTIRWRFAS